MQKSLAPIALCIAGCLNIAAAAGADEVLRVQGHIVKWPSPAAGLPTVITYALLAERFSLPRTNDTLSPDNCSAMRPFAEIATATAVSEVTVKRELIAAFAAWEEVAGIRFVQVSEPGRAGLLFGATDGAIGPAFANLSLAGGRAMDPAAKALGSANNNRTMDFADRVKHRPIATIEKAYVCLNPTVPWKVGFDGNLRVFDLRYTFMHEIGHAIGLDHPGSSGSIMGYRYDERARALQPSDVASAQWLYGPPLAK